MCRSLNPSVYRAHTVSTSTFHLPNADSACTGNEHVANMAANSSAAAAHLYAAVVYGSQLSAHALPANAFLLVNIQHHHLQAYRPQGAEVRWHSQCCH